MNPDRSITAHRRSLQQERKQLTALPAEQAMARILDAPQPAALVHAFPAEDLYVLIHDIGAQDALPLIGLASDSQREFILDMELWDRDRIDPAATRQWLALFSQADPAGLARYLMDRRTDFAEYVLFRNIEVKIREHDQDPSDFGDDFFTVDNVFYVRIRPFSDEDATGSDVQPKALLTEILGRMAERDHVTYQKILLEAAAIVPAEYEEEAFRLRNVRLAEKGFLPFEEAVAIYRPTATAAITAMAEKAAGNASDEASEPAAAPLYPARLMGGQSLFAAALQQVGSDKALERIQTELAALCNRIAVADRKKIRSRETLAGLVEKAGGYLSIGLERLAGDDRSAGCARTAALIGRYPLAEIFRVGYTAAHRLKQQTDAWCRRSWFRRRHLPLTFWGEQWLGVLGGLLLKRPLFFDNYRTGVLYREFATLDEIRLTETALAQVIAFDELLDAMDLQPIDAPAAVPLNHANLVLTLWAAAVLGTSGRPGPMPLSDFRRFFDHLWAAQRKPRHVAAAARSDFTGWLADRSGWTEDEISRRLKPVIDALFTEIESELGAVSSGSLDPRFVHLFLLENPAHSAPRPSI